MEPSSSSPLSSLTEAERFHLFVANVVDYAIYMLSPEGIVSTWNAGAQRFKGYTADEIIGRHFSSFYTEEDKATDLPARALRTAREQGKFEGEGWRMRKDGSRFWAHVVIDPIFDDSGTLIGFAKVTRDITERRQAAAELDRTKEALFQSQKLEAIGKLTGGVAHDFNNLLNVIIGGLDMLAADANTQGSRKIIDNMQRAASRGSALVQQLLAFARQQPLRQSVQNLNRVIGSFEAVLRRANKDSVAFDLQLAGALPPVRIDPAQFEAALLNLVINARDATAEGDRITLATADVELRSGEVNHLPAGRYVKVSVNDTGTGMPPEIVRRAVEPFFTTKEIGKGTGMGLSQVYGLVQQSGGDLSIASEVGKGTSVSLYLPALDVEQEGTARDTENVEKALVVDDQPDVLDMTIELFRNLGYDVLSANNGKDALEILQRTPDIDVLFTDVVMPGMSGIQLGRQARLMKPGLKIILASGYAAPALLAEESGLEQFQFLNKPYRISEIVRKLRVAA